MKFLALPVDVDPEDDRDTIDETIRVDHPSWTASPGDPMTVLRNAFAELSAEAKTLATRMTEEAFAFQGTIAGLPRRAETAATGTATFTARDDQGPYVVPEGLELAGRDAYGQPVGFRTVAEATIENGETTVVADIEAILGGEGGNGATDAEFAEYVDYLTAVEFVGTTAGGVDQESVPDYLDRLVEEFSLPRTPVLPEQFATFARRLGAYRAVAIDGLDPSDDSMGNDATVALAMIDEDGVPLPTLERDAIVDAIDALREVGFQVFPFDPTVTAVDVSFEITPHDDADPAAALDAAEAAVADYLSPATWGAREDTAEVREWLNETEVRLYEIAERILRVESVRYLVTGSLEIALDGDALAAADVTLPGLAPLPEPGTISGSVT